MTPFNSRRRRPARHRQDRHRHDRPRPLSAHAAPARVTPTTRACFCTTCRFDANENRRPEFVLNQPAYRDAKILVTGPDFGCGSSRESAAYAVLDYGVRALIGASFGDVFVGNCMQNGVLPIVLPTTAVENLWRQLQAMPGAIIQVDLAEQTVTAPNGAAYVSTSTSRAKNDCSKGSMTSMSLCSICRRSRLLKHAIATR